ncbi:hypothetical protein F5146DRAFT_932029 [Armillaria mellea]|nr:hypothetical protein F5146DRAFT_932029 [Armillaria mellea]
MSPCTVATYACLNLFMVCMLMWKMSTFNFYKSLTYLTDLLGLKIPKVWYRKLCLNIYRHLLLLMYGEKGNEQEGVNNVNPGELAMECPVCPCPGVNLPEDWWDAPNLLKYLYWKLIAIDTNFCLQNLLKSDNIMDLGLHSGLAYFVELIKYKEHVVSTKEMGPGS